MSVKKDDIDLNKILDKAAGKTGAEPKKKGSTGKVEPELASILDAAAKGSLKKKDGAEASTNPSEGSAAGAVPGTTSTTTPALKWEDNPLNPVKAINEAEAKRDKTPEILFRPEDQQKLNTLLVKHRVAPTPTAIEKPFDLMPGSQYITPRAKTAMEIEYDNAVNVENTLKSQLDAYRIARQGQRASRKSKQEEDAEKDLLEVQNLKRKAATELVVNGDKEIEINRRTNEIGNSFNQFMSDLITLNQPIKGVNLKVKETEDKLKKVPSQFLTGVNMLKLTEPAEYERVQDAIANGLPISASQEAKITNLGLNIEEAKLKRDMLKSPVTPQERQKFDEVGKILNTIKPDIDKYVEMIKAKQPLSPQQTQDYQSKIKQYNDIVNQSKPLIEKVNAIDGAFAKKATQLLETRKKNILDNPEVLRGFIADGVANKLDEIGKIKQVGNPSPQGIASDFMLGHTWSYSPEQIKWASEQYLKEQGIDPNSAQAQAAIKFLQDNEGVMIGENSIAKAGGFRELGEGLIEPIVGISKTIKDISRSSNTVYAESQSAGNVDVAKKRLESEDAGVRGVMNDVLKGTGQFATQAAIMYGTSGVIGALSEGLMGKAGVELLANAKAANMRVVIPFDDATANIAAGKFLSNIKDPLSVFTTSYAMSYDGNLKAALSYTSDNSLAKKAAAFNASMEGATELFLSPLDIARGIYSKFSKNQTKDLLKILSDKSLKNDPSALKEYVGKFVKGVAATAKVSGAEIGEEMVTQISDYVTNMYLNPEADSFKNRDLKKELMTTAYQTGLSMAVPALLNGIGAAKANSFSKGSLLVAAQNRQAMVDDLNRSVAQGAISQEYATQQIQLINTAAVANAEVPKKASGADLNTTEKANYIWSRVTEAYMEKQMSSTTDAATKEIWKDKIAKQQEYRKQIIGLSEEQPEVPEYTIDDKAVSRDEFLATAEKEPEDHNFVVAGDEEAQQKIRDIGGIDDNANAIKGKDKVKEYVGGLAEDNYLFTHVTTEENAKSITENGMSVSLGTGISSTLTASGKDNVTNQVERLMNGEVVHRDLNNNSVAIISVPKAELDKMSGKTLDEKFENWLVENNHIDDKGKLSIPKEFNAGYLSADSFISTKKAEDSKQEESIPSDAELIDKVKEKQVKNYEQPSISELKEQALQAPDSFRNQFDDEELTVNLIAKNSTEQIENAIKYQEERLTDPSIDIAGIVGIDKHIQLLELGLEKNKKYAEPKEESEDIEYEDLPQNVKDIVDQYGDANDKTEFQQKLEEAGYTTDYDMESFGTESGVTFKKIEQQPAKPESKKLSKLEQLKAKKGIKSQSYNLADGTTFKATPVEIEGLEHLDTVVGKEDTGMNWKVVEVATGKILSEGFSKDEAIDNAKAEPQLKKINYEIIDKKVYMSKYSAGMNVNIINQSGKYENYLKEKAEKREAAPLLYTPEEIARVKAAAEKLPSRKEWLLGQMDRRVGEGMKIGIDYIEKLASGEISEEGQVFRVPYNVDTRLPIEEKKKRALTKAKNIFNKRKTEIENSSDLFKQERIEELKDSYDKRVQQLTDRYEELEIEEVKLIKPKAGKQFYYYKDGQPPILTVQDLIDNPRAIEEDKSYPSIGYADSFVTLSTDSTTVQKQGVPNPQRGSTFTWGKNRWVVEGVDKGKNGIVRLIQIDNEDRLIRGEGNVVSNIEDENLEAEIEKPVPKIKTAKAKQNNDAADKDLTSILKEIGLPSTNDKLQNLSETINEMRDVKGVVTIVPFKDGYVVAEGGYATNELIEPFSKVSSYEIGYNFFTTYYWVDKEDINSLKENIKKGGRFGSKSFVETNKEFQVTEIFDAKNQTEDKIVKNIDLDKQINLLSADFLEINKPEVTPGSQRIKIVDVPLTSISTDTSSFQNRETEFSQESVDKILKAVQEDTFTWTEFDPITLWKNNGQLYVLSGHSRFEAFKQLTIRGYAGFDTIPAEIFEGSKEDAIAIALRSNTLSTKETPIERANYYREARLHGTSSRAILNEAKEYEGRNAPTIIALSYLNPNGKAIAFLKALGQEGDTKSKANSLQMARWTGEVRQQFPQLTNEHENEIFDWLKDGAYSKIKNLAEISSRINNVVSGFDFNAENPLNLAHKATKSYVDETYEQQLSDKEKQIKDQQKIIADKQTKYNEAQLTPQEVAEKLVPDNAILSRMQQDYIKLKEKKGAISEANKGILSLFDNIQTEIDNGNITEQQVDAFINNTEQIEEDDTIIEDIERNAESPDTAARSIQEGEQIIAGEDVNAKRIEQSEANLAEKINVLEKEKTTRLNEIMKPDINMQTMLITDLFTLAGTTEGNRQEYEEIKNQLYGIKNLIDCLFS